MLWKVSKDLPDYEVLAKYEPPVMTRIHANDGNLIAEFARERRIYVPFKAIPDRLVEAFLSAEEARHYVEQWEETVEMRTNFTVRPVTPLQSSFGRVSRHLRKESWTSMKLSPVFWPTVKEPGSADAHRPFKTSAPARRASASGRRLGVRPLEC